MKKSAQFFMFFCVFCFISCFPDNTSNVNYTKLKKRNILVENKIDDFVTENYDTLNFFEISENCALFTRMTDAEIFDIEKENGKENSETILDDLNYYWSEAYTVLDSLKINTKVTESRFLIYKTRGSKICIDTRKFQSQGYTVFLFNSEKLPVFIDVTEIDIALIKTYFNL